VDVKVCKVDRKFIVLSRQRVVAMVARTVVAGQRDDVIVCVIGVARRRQNRATARVDAQTADGR